MCDTETTSDYGVDVLRDEIVRRILEGCAEYIEKDGDNYDVNARNLHFTCSYSDDEIKKIADLCLALMEELRDINDRGFTKHDYETVEKAAQEKDISKVLSVYSSYKTDRIEDLISQLGDATRVGGAYYMLVVKPAFLSSINSVFKFIIDDFEDPQLYFSALFMLIRLAMHMHSNEVDE